MLVNLLEAIKRKKCKTGLKRSGGREHGGRGDSNKKQSVTGNKQPGRKNRWKEWLKKSAADSSVLV